MINLLAWRSVILVTVLSALGADTFAQSRRSGRTIPVGVEQAALARQALERKLEAGIPLAGGQASVRFLPESISDSGQIGGLCFLPAGGADRYRPCIWDRGTVVDLGYSLSPSGPSGPHVNRRGQAAGSGLDRVGPIPWHALLWEDGELTDLGSLGGPFALASGITERGQVFGQSETSNGRGHAFLWDAGLMTDLGALPDGGGSNARFANERGQVVVEDLAAPPYGRWFLWQDGTITELGDFYGGPINDQGQIAGVNITGRAAIWENGVARDLGTLGHQYSWAIDINDRGQVIGESYDIDESGISAGSRAFLWDGESLRALGPTEQMFSFAHKISDHPVRVLVGAYDMQDGVNINRGAYLWERGELIDLGTLGGAGTSAIDMNNRGEVIGYSETATGETHPFLRRKGVMIDLWQPASSVSDER